MRPEAIVGLVMGFGIYRASILPSSSPQMSSSISQLDFLKKYSVIDCDTLDVNGMSVNMNISHILLT